MGQSDFERELLKQLPMVRRWALSLCRRPDLADDLMQETAMRALSHQDGFDGKNMAAWLTTICRNLYRSMWRNDGRREEPLTDVMENYTADPKTTAYDGLAYDGGAAQELDARQTLAQTIKAVNGSLPLALALADGMSYEELAIKFEVPQGTIKSRVHRMRDHARKIIGRDLPVPPVKSKPKPYKRTNKWVLAAADRSARIKAGRAKAKAERCARLGL